LSRNLIARLAVAAVAIPAILWICYQGGWWLLGMITVFATVAALEFLHQEHCRPSSVPFWLSLSAVLSVLVIIAYSLLSRGDTLVSTALRLWLSVPAIMLAYFLLLGMFLSLGNQPPAQLFSKYVRLWWGVAYIGSLYAFVYLVGDGIERPFDYCPSGGDYLLFLFGLLWVGDTAAMWVGSAFGKHKLAPTVSPNKTVEGFVGGLLGALAIAMLMAFWKFHMVPWYHLMFVALGCSVCGQLGDLTESMWKRSLGIKDSSAVIPGHGGVLDRFDSLLFAAPVMYVYMSVYWA
jgi:phosphatidate cytidylyltransferase